jgi:fumarylacetoacetase
LDGGADDRAPHLRRLQSRTGDLIGTGTISAPDGVGSMLELTRGGREPATLPSGETRRFLDDGDEVIFRAYARRDGFAQIGFGECRGRVVGTL